MKTSRNTNPKGRRDSSGGGGSRDGINTRGKYFYPKYLQEKLAITVLVITLALFALILVLYRIIRDNNEQYNKIVLTQRQQEYESRTLPYRRGDIVDRNGTYLATSEKVYNLILDPRLIMSSPENYLEPTIQALVEAFGYDRGELQNLIDERKTSAYVKYNKGRQLTYEQRTAFEQLVKDTNTAYSKSENDGEAKKRVKGVWFEEEYKRIYPYNSLACNVIGFTSADGAAGTGGIEQYYNSSLMGVNGREYGYLDADSNLEGVVKPATNGKTIVSTIDVNVQNILQKYINEWQTTVGSRITAAVAMDPRTGEILAMGSSNVFDLNNPRDVSGFTEAELMELGTKEAAAVYKRKNDGAVITEDQVFDHFSREDVLSYGQQVAWNQIWRNFCVSDTYEPGSPSKIFTVAAALEEGVLGKDESFECGGFLHVADRDIFCVNRYGHGTLTVQESLMYSCNVCMMRISQRLGRDKFSKYMELFGFGDKTGIDLPGEADTSGLVYKADNMGPTDLATNSFGQNYNCTMVQMAAAFCSVINGGSYYEPHVVKQILNEQGSVVEKKDPVLVRETVSQSTSDFLNETMFRTVEEGTGKVAQVSGYEVGGKTGTAERQPRSEKNYLVSFAGYAPVEDPQIFVYVVIDIPNYPPGPMQAHSSYASAIFSKIMTEALPYLNVFPAADLPESESAGESQPSPEGINEPETGSGEETEEAGEAESETHVQRQTDEYIVGDPGDDTGSGVPDAVPTDPNRPEGPSADPLKTGNDRPSAEEQPGGNVPEGRDAPSMPSPGGGTIEAHPGTG
ncbi:MAG: penicillin-binding protein 2 [Clostridium sp.]|nr:penicillin-binding protein 2 [Clostridium sp.]